jgi:pimeloyl-ACP methyl ester carboxylesterase
MIFFLLLTQGTADVVFSAANAQEGIKRFVNSKDARLVTLENGVHFLSFTHKKEVHGHILEFTSSWK